MARVSKEVRLRNLHTEAMQAFDVIQRAVRPVRQQCLEDRRFYSIAGAQWEGELGAQFESRPKIEVNKVHLSVMRIINEYRNNRITVDFVAKDGSEDEELADFCDGLYRADEQRSTADEAYDNAFEEAVGGGFGAWRLRTEYEDEYDDENDYQRICIEPIFDADTSVFFDLDAKRQDKSDAKRCFVITSMTRDAYKEEWGDDPASWPKDDYRPVFDWCTIDVVYVAEYYRVEEKTETVYRYVTLMGEEERYTDADFEDDPELEGRLADVGTRRISEKRVKRRKVHKYILSGGGVLDDCGYIAGDCIPIIPVYGKRWFVDNIERCMGHVRLAKDAQRLKNMQLSKLGEWSAYSTLSKPIFTPEQMVGHANTWAEDNVKNYPYLLINPVADGQGNLVPTGPVGYTKSPEIPPAMAALLQISETDMQDILGNQQAGEEMVPQMSGKAVELVQARLDMQAFIYMSNMSKAVKRCGEVWLSMAREVLVEPGRKMKMIGGQGEVETAEIGAPILDLKTGRTIKRHDLSRAKFDVVVDVGPSSSSRRAATVRALTGMLQIAPDPETQQVLSAMALMNMEGEGISEVRGWFRKKLLTMGVVDPTKDEAEEMAAAQQAAQQPDPQAMLLQAAAQEAQAKAIKAQADTALSVAKTEETQARTAETLAGISLAERDQALRAAEGMARAITRATPAVYQG